MSKRDVLKLKRPHETPKMRHRSLILKPGLAVNTGIV